MPHPLPPNRRRWWLTAWLLLALTVLVALVTLAVRIGSQGDTQVEQWVGSQLQAVVNRYLHPQLAFASLDYRYPRTVVLQAVRLVVPNPAHRPATEPSPGTEVFRTARLVLTLAQVPRRGQPIRIEKLRLEHPAVLIRPTHDPQNPIAGYSHFLKTTAGTDSPSHRDAHAVQLSDVFDLRLIEIAAGRLVYHPPPPPEAPSEPSTPEPSAPPQPTDFPHATPPAEPMTLDNIHCRLTASPSADGWHTLDLTLGRTPLMELALRGRLHLDHALVDITCLKAATHLGPSQNHTLPPPLRRLVQQHHLTGCLTAQVTGRVNLRQPPSSQLQASVELADADIQLSHHRLPIQQATLAVQLADHQLVVESLDAALLGGHLRATSRLPLTPGALCQSRITLQDIRIEQAWAAPPPTPTPPGPTPTGRLDGQITHAAPQGQFTTQATGQVQLALRDGRLAGLPLVATLLAAIQPKKKPHPPDAPPKGSQSLDLTATFQGDHLRIDALSVTGWWYALRGTGDVYLDPTARLDLVINAGPLEKIQSLLGPLGRGLAALTDQVMCYRVTGTLAEPQVNAQLGTPADRPSPAPRDTINPLHTTTQPVNLPP